jgi:tape measure domain-containing protein
MVQVTAQFESLKTTIDFATGSQKEGAKSFQFLISLANRYGKDLQTLASTYSSFTASSNLAGISLDKSNKIFESAVKASAALGKSNADTQGILIAFSQIVSKGTVMAEELRGQLGERIPGAFSIMAKALKVNEQQLNKMLEQGQVLSKDALPKFAKELENAFGETANAKVSSLTASLGRFTTAWDRLLNSPGIGKVVQREVSIWTGYINKIRELTTDEATLNEERQDQTLLNIKENAKNEVEIAKKKYNEINKANASSRAVAQMLLNKDKDAYEALLTRVKFFNLEIDKRTLENVNARREVLQGVINEANERDKIAQEIIPKTVEQLKKEYEAKVKLLELDKKIADIRIQLSTEEGPERDLKLLRNAAEFGQKRLTIDRFYAAQGVNDAVENAKIQVYIVRKQTDDIIVEIKRQAQEGANQTKAIKAQLEKQIQDNDDYETKKEQQRQESIQKEAEYQKEIVKLNQQKADAIKEIDKKSKAEQKALEKDLHDISIQEIEAFAYAAGEISDLITNRRLDNIYREYTAFQKSYSEEVRLAGDNQQKLAQLEEKRLAKERELRRKEFEAQQQNAIAQVIFKTAPIIAEYFSTGYLAPAAIAALAVQAAQIAYIVSTPVPEFAEGTKGTPFKGTAIVGEKGPEKVVTESGKVYFTPGVATLAQFDEAVQIIPNNQLGLHDRQHLSLMYANSTKKDNSGMQIVAKLDNIEKGLAKMPVAAISLDAKGFQKSIRTQSRETTILNNRMRN